MTFIPAHSVVQAPGAAPQMTAFVLHGILGHKRNWRSYAKTMTNAYPHWKFVLIDLRNHGQSQASGGPHTVAQAALDLVALSKQIGPPQAVIGHSFGGKVALLLSGLIAIEQSWILDAIPGEQPEQAQQELRTLFHHLRTAGAPFQSRELMKERLEEKHLPNTLIQWMTTNLIKTNKGYNWTFNLANATEMIEDYFRIDAYPFLQDTSHPIHIVRARNNNRWSKETLSEILSVGPLVHLHTLERAGHWVHIDNPSGLRDLMDPYFRA